jgi:hypothetical protein
MLAPARPEIAAYTRPRSPAAPARRSRDPGRGQKLAATAAALLCAWTVYADPVARERARLMLQPLISAAPALKFGPASARRVELDGQTVLYVEGSLRNEAKRTLKTPTLIVTLVGDDGQPLYSWKAKPPQSEIRPSAAIAYQTRLASPPERFNHIAVSLADAR